MVSRLVALSAGLAALGVLPAPAVADCSAPGFNPSNKFCDGCSYEAYMTLGRDQVCVRPYLANGNANSNSMLQIYDHRLLQHAKHGIAGLNATTMAYSPAKGFVGSDDFLIEVLYRETGHYGKFKVHWNVSVQ
jgi:hypothetical protein